MSISVVYWSGTGNTQAMAEAVAEGIRSAGADSVVMEVSDADAAGSCGRGSICARLPVHGCRAAGRIRDGTFVEMLEPLVSGRKILLFGSYGWGDGEWMRGAGCEAYEGMQGLSSCERKA